MRLGDLDAIEKFIEDGLNNPNKLKAFGHDAVEIMTEIHYAPTIDAVPVERLEQVKNEILYRMDKFITEYRFYSESTVDHFGGKAEAMDVARRLVNASLTDLCSHGERKAENPCDHCMSGSYRGCDGCSYGERKEDNPNVNHNS